MNQYDKLKDSILEYIETRNSESLYDVLTETPQFLIPHDEPIYRGFTALEGSLELGGTIRPLDYIMSWTTNLDVAEYFARYNKELLRYDDIVLDDLGIGIDDVSDLIKPVILMCTTATSTLLFNDYILPEDITDESLRNEDEIVVNGDSEFVIANINSYRFKDSQMGYLVTVGQLQK